jgi:hypothetical protein
MSKLFREVVSELREESNKKPQVPSRVKMAWWASSSYQGFYKKYSGSKHC